MSENVKKWYQSKTILAGIIMVATAGLEAYQSSAEWATIVLACFGALTIVLRAKTSKAITR